MSLLFDRGMPIRISFFAVFLMTASTLQNAPQLFGQETPEQITFAQTERGRLLFQKKWTEIETEDPNASDGLGPMFNAESCVACHNQSGVGGSGDNSTNVQLLTALPRQTSKGKFRLDDIAVELMFRNAGKIHSTLGHTNSIVLHRSSTKKDDFENWQKETLEFRSLKKAKPDSLSEKLLAERQKYLFDDEIYRVRKSDPRNRFTLQISRRNTPSLFGVGIIDQIPDEAIEAIAKQQAASDGPVKGIVSKGIDSQFDERVGKFGWRGQHVSVRDFTLEACAVELGLSTSEHSQTIIPFRPFNDFKTLEVEERISQPQSESFDMTKTEVDDLNNFVLSLPFPAVTPLSDIKDSVIHNIGKKHFNEIGCSQCHVEVVGPAFGVYSDFLLHDMGRDLADAAGTINRVRKLGGQPNLKIANDRLWQTPSLWNSARSAPYLHDGRAKNMKAAILMHAGEAAFSALGFQGLNSDEKDELLFFLDIIGNGNRARQRPFVASGGWSSSPTRQGRLVNRR